MYYKALKEGRRAPISRYIYPEVGKWTPGIKGIEICNRGYHVCKKKNILYWASNDSGFVYEVQTSSIGIYNHNKAVFSSIRLMRLAYNITDKKILDYIKTLPEYEKYIKYTTSSLYSIKYTVKKDIDYGIINIILNIRKNYIYYVKFLGPDFLETCRVL